ncbi:DUF4132 domain-containing protein [Streptomyces sp. NPDC013953]|uniref:DUF4132 domain-containing protein n=1 Tax=Streptomyces sp. NPDC013953 TaxID=3364868 RepID=UPI0036F83CC4
MGWIDTESDGYAVTLDGMWVVCRNRAGRTLKQVPAKLRDDAQVVRLRQLAEWLERHERECREQVDAWLVRSLPVPVELLARVWPDAAWQGALRDLVVAPVGADGSADVARAGFLRDADPDPARGLGIVDLDGDSVRLGAEQGVEAVLIPHPVLLLEDLDDLREFAVELGVEQGAQQLFREVWRRPERLAEGASGWDAYARGRFAELRHATSRAASLGFRVRGGYAVCPLVEDGLPLEAAYWLGDEYPEAETETGALEWRDRAGRRLPLAEVGPVAWSEGERMAALVYAGRVVDEEGDKR